MKYLTPVFLLIIFLGSVSAQNFKGSLNPFPENQKVISQEDTLKILAIMVSFQEDRDGTTFGNGKFESIYTRNYGNDILDPLPHNSEYFESHLSFVKNYFNKVSKGKLSVEFTVLPDTFSVSQVMRNYSPPPGDNDFTPIADFSTEAWTLADQIYPGFPFSNYDVFLVFHAGVGRDVSLPGSIGNERDLPSVYLSERAFKNIYGESFPGIPVSGGSFYIKNSMIIPETESREVQTITGTFLFELTINGLLCASIASHLGLPDLFDTETGLSAIGRFGLMDGQGIFAYNGCFPPEPSPWSKIYLGWIDPVTLDISSGEFNINLVTETASAIGDTSVLKIPLNSSEYFLVENRVRDANNDGSIVTSVINGSTITKTFPKDTTGFYSFDTDSLSGVITDVDEFDWALPGSGIVIWHIDENVINEKIAENKINTDKNRRGVDVEEADGIQDIGERFITIFGDVVIGEGTEEDFWYASNPAELFQNRFAKDTRPNTRTNSGANSLIKMKNFSGISNRMNFKVELGDSIIKPLFTYMLNTNGVNISLSALTHCTASQFDYTSIYGLVDSTLVISDQRGQLNRITHFSRFKPAGISNNCSNYIYGVIDSTLNIVIDSILAQSINISELITAPPLVRVTSQNAAQLLIGTNNGRILIYDISNNPVLLDSFVTTSLTIKQIASEGGYFSFLAASDIQIEPPTVLRLFDNEGNSFSFNEVLPAKLEVTKNQKGKYISVVLTSDNRFYIIKSGVAIAEFGIPNADSILSFALTDLKKDGSNYIVLNNGINIEAYNLTGAMADNFPFADPDGIGFVGTPLTADFEGNNASEIISITKDGRIFAIDGGTGKIVSGFPISCGSSVSAAPVLFNPSYNIVLGKASLAVLNDQNVLTAWSISSVEGKLYWSEENGNPQNTSFVDAAENSNHINEFFPKSRAYNYPNPVYEGITQIRYYVDEDSKINIKIFDLAGDYVAELNDDAQGGMDNETTWNVNDIQSGVYFARIEATSNSGKTEEVIIKIAVVK